MIVESRCKCGNVKTKPKSITCDECRIYGRVWDSEKMKWHYRHCKCGEVKESYKSNYCIKCQRDIYRRNVRSESRTDYDLELIRKSDLNKRLIKLVTKVEADGGYITLNDLFVEMITLYNHYFNQNGMDNLKPAKQLTTMWKKLTELYYKID